MTYQSMSKHNPHRCVNTNKFYNGTCIYLLKGWLKHTFANIVAFVLCVSTKLCVGPVNQSYWTKEISMNSKVKSIQHLCGWVKYNLCTLFVMNWPNIMIFWNGISGHVDHHVHQQLCKYFHRFVINALQSGL